MYTNMHAAILAHRKWAKIPLLVWKNAEVLEVWAHAQSLDYQVLKLCIAKRGKEAKHHCVLG